MTEFFSYIFEWRKIGKKNLLYKIEIKNKMLFMHGELLCTNKWLTTDNWYDINSILNKHTDKYFKDNRHMECNKNLEETYKDLVNENILLKIKFETINPYFKRFFKLRDKFYDECMNVEILESDNEDENIVNKKSSKKYNDNYIPECLASNKSSPKQQCNYTPSKKGKEVLPLKNESYEPESMIKNVEESIKEEVVYKPSSTSNDKLHESDSDRYSPKPISNESIVLPNKVYTPTKIDSAITPPLTSEPSMAPSSSYEASISTDIYPMKKTPLRKCRSQTIDYNDDRFTPIKIKRKDLTKEKKRNKEENSRDSKKNIKRVFNDLFSSDEEKLSETKNSMEIKITGDNNNNNTEQDQKRIKEKKDRKTTKEEKYMKKKYKIKKFTDTEDYFAGRRFCDYLSVETILNTFNEFTPILMEEYNNYCKNKVLYIVEHQKPDKNIILEVYKIFHCDKVLEMIQYIKKYFLNINKDVDHDEFVFNGATPEWCLFIMMKELQLNRIDAIIKLKE